jgi:hypothetical protein
LRHFIRTERPATFSSAIWYFALQLGQRNFIQPDAVEVDQFEDAEYREASIPTSLFSTARRARWLNGRPVSPSGRQAEATPAILGLGGGAHRGHPHPSGPVQSSFSRC